MTAPTSTGPTSTGPTSTGPWRIGSVTALEIVVCLIVAGVVVAPLVTIVVTGADARSVPILVSGGIARAALNSLVSAGLSALIAVAVGTVLALLLDATTLPGRRVLRVLLLSPALVPPFVGAIAWVGVLGPQSPINQGWTRLTGAPLWNVYGADGVVFLLALHSFPIAYLVIGAALRRVPGDLLQAARISGAGPLRSLVDVALPLLYRGILAAFVLIAVSNLADFGIPSIVGLPEGYDTLATTVYRYIQSGTVEDPLAVVSSIGIVLIAIAAAGVLLLTPRSRGTETVHDAAPVPLRLGRGRWAIAIVTGIVAVALTVLPLLALVEQAFLIAPGLPLVPASFSPAGFLRAVTDATALSGIAYSVALSLGAAVVCGALGLVIGTLTTRIRWRGTRVITVLVLLPQAIPGLIVAVGWLLIAPTLGIFDTPAVILGAYVMAFTGIVLQSVTAPLQATSGSLEEAARISGAGPLRTLVDVSLRLAVPPAVMGAALVALTAVRELTISVLLLAPGTTTLGVAIFSLQQSGAFGAASSLSLLVTIVGLAALALTGARRRVVI